MSADGWGPRVEGMERSYANAKEEWKAAALEAVFLTAQDMPEFIADDVWGHFPEGFARGNGSALGCVMRQAKAEQWIETSGRFSYSPKSALHCKAKTIWKSLIHGEL